MLLILSSYKVSRYFHVRIIIALLYEDHGILTFLHVLQDPVLLVIWSHIIPQFPPLCCTRQNSHRPTTSPNLLQEKVLWGNIILDYSLAQAFWNIKEVHLPGLLIEIKPTSKSLPSTGTCILEVSIKDGVQCRWGTEKHTALRLCWGPYGVFCSCSDNTEAGGWPPGRCSGKARLGLLICCGCSGAAASVFPTACFIHRGRLGRLAGAWATY